MQRNNTNRARTRTRKSKNAKNNDNVRGVSVRPGQTLILKSPGMIVPDRLIVPLNYTDETYNRTSNTNIAGGWALRPTAPYDPDPALGSGSITGFSELAALYNSYRVLVFRYTWNVVNNESFPVLVFSFPTYGGITITPANVIQYSEGPYVRKRILAAKGGMDRAALSHNLSVPQFLGSKYALFDDNWKSLVNTVPALNIFQNFVFQSGTAAPFTSAGISSFLNVIMTVEFFERKAINA